MTTDDLTFALVREFLQRNNFSNTLSAFVSETQGSKISRADLIKNLNLTKLYMKNKQRPTPLPSLLQCLVDSLVTAPSSASSEPVLSVPRPKTVDSSDSMAFSRPSKAKSLSKDPSHDRLSIASSKSSRPLSSTSVSSSDVCVADIICDQDDHTAQFPSFSSLSLSSTINTLPYKSLSGSDILTYVNVIIEDRRPELSESWFQPIVQSITINQSLSRQLNSTVDYKPFLLHQEEGGPCGVISVFQATLLKNQQKSHQKFGNLNDFFVESFAEIICRCSQSNSTFLMIPFLQSNRDFDLRFVLRSCRLYSFSSLSDLKLFLTTHWSLIASGCGYLTLLLSSIATRSPQSIITDGGLGRTPLITKYGYCAQELVNLLLVGVASGQVFDGNLNVDGQELSGIPTRSEVGFLTVFEYFKYLSVGNYLKQPKNSVYVLMAENHYSVFFQRNSDPFWTYWDPLGRLDDVVRCFIKRDEGGFSGDELLPIEMAIRTKFGNFCKIKWEGIY
ncbi:hypothetical protein RCL1_002428 [Eukaryota sp. TZLM3-RCL]